MKQVQFGGVSTHFIKNHSYLSPVRVIIAREIMTSLAAWLTPHKEHPPQTEGEKEAPLAPKLTELMLLHYALHYANTASFS